MSIKYLLHMKQSILLIIYVMTRCEVNSRFVRTNEDNGLLYMLKGLKILLPSVNIRDILVQSVGETLQVQNSISQTLHSSSHSAIYSFQGPMPFIGKKSLIVYILPNMNDFPYPEDMSPNEERSMRNWMWTLLHRKENDSATGRGLDLHSYVSVHGYILRCFFLPCCSNVTTSEKITIRNKLKIKNILNQTRVKSERMYQDRLEISYILIGNYIQLICVLHPYKTKFGIALRDCTHMRPYLQYWIKKDGVRVFDGPEFRMGELMKSKGFVLENVYTVSNHHTPAVKTLHCLRNRTCDIALTYFYFTSERYQLVDYSGSLGDYPLCVVLRKASIISFGLVLLLPYRPHMWVAILASLLVFIAVWTVTRQLNELESATRTPNRGHSDIVHVVIDVVQTMLSGSNSYRASTFAQRLMVANLSVFSLVLSYAYTGQLLGFLTSPPHFPDPQTLTEANDVIRHVYSFVNYFHVLNNEGTGPALKRLSEKLVLQPMSEMNAILKNISEQGSDAFIVGPTMRDVVRRSVNLTSNGGSLMHIVPECIIHPGHVAHVTRKNMPYFDLFNQFTMQVVQAGLPNYWLKAQHAHMTAHGLMVPKGIEVRYSIPLSLSQLVGSILVLCLGLSTATCVFAVEKMHGWIFGLTKKLLEIMYNKKQ